MNTKCKIGHYKTCIDCKRGFVDDIWCGDVMCQRCLDMCWVVNDPTIIERIFNCCDYHRPHVNMHNINVEVDCNDDTTNHLKKNVDNDTFDGWKPTSSLSPNTPLTSPTSISPISPIPTSSIATNFKNTNNIQGFLPKSPQRTFNNTPSNTFSRSYKDEISTKLKEFIGKVKIKKT